MALDGVEPSSERYECSVLTVELQSQKFWRMKALRLLPPSIRGVLRFWQAGASVSSVSDSWYTGMEYGASHCVIRHAFTISALALRRRVPENGEPFGEYRHRMLQLFLGARTCADYFFAVASRHRGVWSRVRSFDFFLHARREYHLADSRRHRSPGGHCRRTRGERRCGVPRRRVGRPLAAPPVSHPGRIWLGTSPHRLRFLIPLTPCACPHILFSPLRRSSTRYHPGGSSGSVPRSPPCRSFSLA